MSDDDRRFVAARAATLQEVLAIHRLDVDSSSTVSAEAAGLAAWNRAYSPGDNEAFTKRLSWDDLDWDRALQALSQDPALLFEEPPPWTRWLARFGDEASAFADERAVKTSFAEAAYFNGELPFLELSAPLLRAAVNNLAATHAAALDIDTLAARQSMERQLLLEITRVWELALYEQFVDFRDTSSFQEISETDTANENAGYQAFVSRMLTGRLSAVFETYPVLARLLARLTQTWTEAVAEFLDRLRCDVGSIADTFLSGNELGKITWAQTGISDRHDGGRRVIVLAFESGLRLVYKPRDVRLEQAYNRFLSWCSRNGLDPCPKPLKILARNGYGWVEYVAQEKLESEDAARLYYRQSGCLICLAHVLRGQDLHMENLVATSEGPVLIDTEMLIQPVAAKGVMGIDSEPVPPPWDAVRASCVETGLLSLMQTDPSGDTYDIGGLRGRGGYPSPVKKRVWISSGTDAMHFVESDDYGVSQKNQVHLDEAVLIPDRYANEVIDGFSRTYRFLMSNRDAILSPSGPLREFEGKKTRIVFRTTRQYAVLQHLLNSPKYQKDGKTRGFVMEALNRVFRRETDRPRLWPLVWDEKNSLENLDIPRFTVGTESTMLRSEGGEQVDGVFTRSGLTAVEELLSTLSESQLEMQVGDLREALNNSLDSRFRTPLVLRDKPHEDEPREPADAFQDYAVWIGRELMDHYFGDIGEQPQWTLPVHIRRREAQAPLAPLSLYDGIAGVGLFTAALASATNGAMWRHAALSAVKPLRQLLELPQATETLQAAPLGACEGVGSLVYSLTCMSQLLEDPSLADLAFRYARSLTEDQIDSDVRLDVVGGAAGAILGLLALYHRIREPSVLDLAKRCGNHLLAKGVTTRGGGFAWPVENNHLLAGFAHGAAGIAYALSSLFRLTGDQGLLDVAKRAYLYERSLFSPTKANWPIVQGTGDLSSGPGAFMTAWCHGAPGVGLARVMSLDVLCDDAILGEIDTAIHTTAHLERNRSDHMCCGNLGRSEVILTTGLRMERPDLIDVARAVAVQVTSRAREQRRFFLPTTPFQYSVFTPGFFRGLSGIGYQLLRTAMPQRLPSVLSFEPDSPKAATEQRGQS